MGFFTPSLTWSKVWYFESFATSALLYPLLNLYLRRKGLSETQIGVVAALRPWVSAITGNLWAGLGDITGAHKLILLTTYVSTVLLRYCLGLAPSFAFIAVFVALTESMNAPILILADASSMAAGKTEGDYGKARMWGAVGWGMFSPIAGLLVTHFGAHALFEASLTAGLIGILPTTRLPTESLKHGGFRHCSSLDPEHQESATSAESLPITRIQADEARGDTYSPKSVPDTKAGETTAPSTFPASTASSSEGENALPNDSHGFGAAVNVEGSSPSEAFREGSDTGAFSFSEEDSLLQELGGLLPITPAPETIDYDTHLLDRLHHPEGIRSSQPLPGNYEQADESAAERQGNANPKGLSMAQKLAQIFSRAEVVIFFVMTVLYGFAAGVIDGYVFLFLDQLGAPEVLMGLTITVACIIELPVFHFMGDILKFVGVERMLHWVLFFFLVRLGCYTFLRHFPSPWLILPVETLNGITFGCAWAAGTVNCSRIAPKGLEATTQAIFSGLYMGFGLGLGGLFGGIVYNTIGAEQTFAGAFAVVLVGWILCALAQQFVRWIGRFKSRTEQDRLQKPLLA